jgi:hypothetical protein
MMIQRSLSTFGPTLVRKLVPFQLDALNVSGVPYGNGRDRAERQSRPKMVGTLLAPLCQSVKLASMGVLTA